MNSLKRILLLLPVLLLTAAATLNLCSCMQKDKGNNDEKTITVTVIDDKSESTVFTITTTASNLEDALKQEGLIDGDKGDYGMYVKVVNGLRADYDKDKAYWSFSKDGVELMTGAKNTIIADGDKYEITYTKA